MTRQRCDARVYHWHNSVLRYPDDPDWDRCASLARKGDIYCKRHREEADRREAARAARREVGRTVT